MHFSRRHLTLITQLIIVGITSSCSLNNVKQDNSLKNFFDDNKVDGCFAMFDNVRAEFTIYNIQRDTARFLPASTFKIMNSLIAMQTGRVVDDSTVIKWDGITRKNANWNQDLTVGQAFKFSSVPHFQEIARRIGRDTMQMWLDSVKYGNMKIGTHIDSFWLDNSLKISPDEQLGLMKKLYFDQLPFQKRVMQVVRNMMIQEDNANYRLSYKTGWGFNEQGHSIGWMVGWIEESRHPYFFVLNIETPDTDADIVSIRKNILTGILTQMGFFKGKM
ncbi:MAG: class D beta-lactamase [Bacteroidetes bacterium]|nr:MAG: class D beta-lactamase [Bacteroidota bacterium]